MAQNIKSLIDSDADVHFTPKGSFSDNLPSVSLDHPIKVGGAVLSYCVKYRAIELQELGYKNVKVDERISFAVPPY